MTCEITTAWLKSVGFQERGAPLEGFTLSSVYRWFLRPVNNGYAFADSAGVYLCVMRTEQDVRDLCKALGAPLDQPSDTVERTTNG